MTQKADSSEVGGKLCGKPASNFGFIVSLTIYGCCLLTATLPQSYSTVQEFCYFYYCPGVRYCAMVHTGFMYYSNQAWVYGLLLPPPACSVVAAYWYMVPSASCCSDVSHLEDVLPPTQSRVCKVAAVQLQRASHNIAYADK